MKKFAIIFITTCICFLTVEAQQSGSTGVLPGKAPSSLDQSKSNPFETAPPAKPGTNKPHIVMPKIPQTTTAFSTPYTLPGIVGTGSGSAGSGKGWIGSDNLYNMKPYVSVYVEVIKPEGKNFNINEAAVKDLILGIFEKGMINSPAPHAPDEPSLPLFHVLIMMNSIDQYTIANIDCRMFESVTLKRIILDPNITFQAITWEKQELIAATEADFNGVFTKTIQNLASNFNERFNYFQTVRARMGN